MQQATKYYTQLSDKRTRCTLCPHNCVIKDGKRGICLVRENTEGHVMLSTYNQIAAMHVDPIEKKPLYHYYPGKNILSVGSIGCNLQCSFCQNWEIAHCDKNARRVLHDMPVKKVVEQASELPENMGIAFTYNEPVVWYEYMYDIAKEAQKNGLKNVVVTNGFINEAPLRELIEVTDAFAVDLKSFNERFYRHLTKSSLKPVLRSIEQIYKAGRHLEITNLVIPGENDSAGEFHQMLEWLVKHTDKDTPLHISRYYPAYKMDNPPTSPDKLQEFYDIAHNYLHHVFLGNIATKNASNTYCKSCGTCLIKRSFYETDTSGLDDRGRCKHCGEKNINFI